MFWNLLLYLIVFLGDKWIRAGKNREGVFLSTVWLYCVLCNQTKSCLVHFTNALSSSCYTGELKVSLECHKAQFWVLHFFNIYMLLLGVIICKDWDWGCLTLIYLLMTTNSIVVSILFVVIISSRVVKRYIVYFAKMNQNKAFTRKYILKSTCSISKGAHLKSNNLF